MAPLWIHRTIPIWSLVNIKEHSHAVDASTLPVAVLWRRRWLILAATAAVGALAVIAANSRPVRYEAFALLTADILHIRGEPDPWLLENYAEATRQAMMMHIELLRSDAAVSAIAGAVGNQHDVEALRRRLRAEVTREPTTLRIAAWDERPERAAAIANAAATYVTSRPTASGRPDDAQARAYLDRLQQRLDQRLAIEAYGLAQASVQKDLEQRRKTITALEVEAEELEARRGNPGTRAEDLHAINQMLSLRRRELSRLQAAHEALLETLENLQQKTVLAGEAYERAYAEHVRLSLSAVSQMARVQLLHAAEVPQRPIPRHLPIILGIGLLCGFVNSSLAFLYIAYSDNRKRHHMEHP